MDMECARSAGTSFIGVLTGSYDRKGWERMGLDALIGSIEELPVFIEDLCRWAKLNDREHVGQSEKE